MHGLLGRILALGGWVILLVLLLFACSSRGVGSTTTLVEYWAGTKSERTQALGACLEEKGWSLGYVRDYSGVLVITFDANIDREAFRQDADACEISILPIKWPETEEEHRLWFERWMEQYRCMVDAGFELDAAPSFDSWYEAMLAEEGYDVPSLLKNPSVLISAVTACPADPEAFW